MFELSLVFTHIYGKLNSLTNRLSIRHEYKHRMGGIMASSTNHNHFHLVGSGVGALSRHQKDEDHERNLTL